MKNKTLMTVKLQADKDLVALGKAGQRIVEITLTAPPEPGERPHVPLNLAMVLDRSGSMHGEKLAYVKEAALHVVDLMTEADRLAVVIYDDKVEMLMPSQFLTPGVKKELKARIKRIASGGSTNLYGGWVTGSRQVAEVFSAEAFNRTLLLTDGLANVGVRDVGTLSMHAQELFSRGISTSCFGVGADYDEYLLEAMANLGGGNFHFLETVQAIPLVFEREFDEIISMVLKDVKITLVLPDGVRGKVAGNWYAKKEGGRLEITLGSLAAKQEQTIYLELSGLSVSDGKALEIPVTVQGMDRDQVMQEVSASLSFRPVPEAEEAAQSQDAGVMERFAVVDLADKAAQALKMERDGDRDAGVRFLRKSMTFHQGNISDETLSKYDSMSDQMSVGLDKAERKRRHFESYQTQRGFQAIRDYPLKFINGALMAEIDGFAVLIHTSRGISFGRVPKWPFLDELYQLAESHEGLTPDVLSKRLGTNVDIVLGMDILQRLFVRIDPQRGLITFSRRPLPTSGWRLPLIGMDGMPVCQVQLGGEDLRMRVMSAFGMSFVPEGLTQGLKAEGEEKVRLPGGAEITTEVFQMPVQLGKVQLPVKCGVLPGDVLAELKLGGSEGVLGGAFFESVPTTLAFPRGELVVYV